MYVPEVKLLLEIVTVLALFVQALVAVILKLLTDGVELAIVIEAVFPEKADTVQPLLVTTPDNVIVVLPATVSAFVRNDPLPLTKVTDADPFETELEPENV